MNAKFNVLLQDDPKNAAMAALIQGFGTFWQPITIRRSENTEWFGEKILELPPVHERDMDVAIPSKLRDALNQMFTCIAHDIYKSSNNQNAGMKDNTFYKTLIRQQLLASTIPWLV